MSKNKDTNTSKKVWKVILIIALLLFFAAAGFSAYYIYSVVKAEREYQELQAKIAAQPTLEEVMEQDYTEREGDSPEIPSELYAEDIEQELIDLGVDVSNPIDFEELEGINTDLYAWIRISDTNIDYPIAQHAEQADYYLHHNMYGQAQFSGSIYSEALNNKDFSDPVTILYGHNMKNGSMFHDLHSFRDKEFFDEHPYVYVYTPEGTLVYQVVSAGVTDDKHIMYAYDFEDEEVFAEYLEDMQKTSLWGKYVREDVELDTDSRILIMSTCVGGNENERYIVQAVRIYDGREEEKQD